MLAIIIRKIAIAFVAAYRVARLWPFLQILCSSLYRLIAFMIATNAVWSGNVVLVGNLFYLILYQPNRCNFDLIFIAFIGLQSRLERAWSKADFDAFYAHLPKRRLLRLSWIWLFFWKVSARKRLIDVFWFLELQCILSVDFYLNGLIKNNTYTVAIFCVATNFMLKATVI